MPRPRTFDRQPRATVAWLSDHLRIARGTVQDRLTRLFAPGVRRPSSTTVRPAVLGHPVRGIVTADLDPEYFEAALSALSQIPEVLECVAVSGEKSLLCNVVARNAEDLYRVVRAVLSCPGIRATEVTVVLRELIALRSTQLLAR